MVVVLHDPPAVHVDIGPSQSGPVRVAHRGEREIRVSSFDAEQHLQRVFDERAMGEYEQVGVVIAFMGPIIHGLHAADTGMFVGFGAMIHLAAHAPAPRVEVLREIGLQVCAGSAFEFTEMPLAQPFVGMHFGPQSIGEGMCRLHRTFEVGGHNELVPRWVWGAHIA